MKFGTSGRDGLATAVVLLVYALVRCALGESPETYTGCKLGLFAKVSHSISVQECYMILGNTTMQSMFVTTFVCTLDEYSDAIDTVCMVLHHINGSDIIGSNMTLDQSFHDASFAEDAHFGHDGSNMTVANNTTNQTDADAISGKLKGSGATRVGECSGKWLRNAAGFVASLALILCRVA